ncbi:MAG: prepilin peptidase [Alphaproteobacteria bacterium]
MPAAFINHVSIASLIGLLVWAAVSDYRTYAIPNRVSLAIAGLYPAHVLAAPFAVEWQGALVMGAVIVAAGFLLFRFGIVGGGDVKLLAATSLWAGPANVLSFLLGTAVFGLILTLLTLSHLRYMRPWPAGAMAADEAAALKLRQSVPYGIAIALGGIAIVPKLIGS